LMVVVIERCGTVWRTPPFGKINGFQVGTAVLDAGDVVFRGTAACEGFAQLFPVCRVGHRDHVGTIWSWSGAGSGSCTRKEDHADLQWAREVC